MGGGGWMLLSAWDADQWVFEFVCIYGRFSIAIKAFELVSWLHTSLQTYHK